MNISRRKLADILCLVVLATSLVSYEVYVWANIAKPSPNRALDDFPSSVSWKVDNDGSSFWGTLYNGSIVYYSLNGADIVQAALNDSYAAGGGCVYVMPGAFGGSVVVRNRTRLVLESGVTGLAFSVASGAYCDVAVWNEPAHLYHYVAGALSFDENLNAGTLAQLSWVNSTSLNCTTLYGSFVNCAVLNNTVGFVREYRLLVENGTSFPSGPSEGYLFERTDFHKLCIYMNGDWVNCSTLDANTYLLANGSQVLTGYLNATSYGVYGAVWLNSTSMSTTYLYLGSLTSDPVGPVAGEMWYNSVSQQFKCYNGSTIVLGSGVVGPAGPAGVVQGLPFSFMVFQNATSNYMVSGLNGSVTYNSSNATQVLQNAYGNASLVKGSVFIKAGTYIINQTTISSNIKIYGEGIGTFIQLVTKDSSTRPLYVNAAQNVTISDLTIDCNIVAYPKTYLTTNIVGIQISESQHVTVQNCYIQNARMYGILVFSTTESYDVNILHNKLYNCMYNGVTFESYGAGASLHDCVVDGNYIQGIGDIAFNTQAPAGAVYPYRIHIINNNVNGTIPTAYQGWGSSLENSTGNGMKLENGQDCWIEGNQFYGVDTGIDETYGGNNTYIGNQIWANGLDNYSGIVIHCTFETIQNNRIYTGYAQWKLGIDIYANNCTIRGNTIINSGMSANVHGIQTESNPNSEIVLDNTVIGCAVSWDAGSGLYDIVHNNIWNGVWSATG